METTFPAPAPIPLHLEQRGPRSSAVEEAVVLVFTEGGMGTGVHSARDTLRAIAAAECASAVRYNGLARYDSALTAAGRACEYEDVGQLDVALAERVESAVRCGELDVAAAALRRLEERAGRDDARSDRGVVACCRALLSDGEAAERLYLEAIGRLVRTDGALTLARVHLLYGEWLRRQRRRIDARAQLRLAYRMFTDLGVRGFAERARRELVATVETARKRTADTRFDLTPQELEIARLAADGYTNAQIGAELFISARTVEWHLRKVFTKLGITSRRELRGAVPKALRA